MFKSNLFSFLNSLLIIAFSLFFFTACTDPIQETEALKNLKGSEKENSDKKDPTSKEDPINSNFQLDKTLTGHSDHGSFRWYFRPMEKVLASASFDKTIKIWDVETGTEVKTFASRFGR